MSLLRRRGLLLGLGTDPELEKFKFTIVTTSPSEDFTVPAVNGETFNAIINYGDGGVNKTITSDTDPNSTNTYAVAGTYQIWISGKFGGFSFNNGGDRLKIISIDQWGDLKLDNIDFGFYGCSNLATLPSSGGIGGTINVASCTSLFRACTSLTDTTNDVLSKLTGLTSALNLFYGCSNLFTLRDGLFSRNLNLVNTANAFYFCTAILTIPVDFLRYNTAITNTTLMFGNCYALTTIPPDFLRYNILLTTVNGMFTVCYLNLKALPEDLFYYNALITNYATVFFRCRNIVLPTRIFNTANLSIVTAFNAFMEADIVGQSNTGTIQDVWNYALSATSTNTFLNQTAMANYASIPNAWKGL